MTILNNKMLIEALKFAVITILLLCVITACGTDEKPPLNEPQEYYYTCGISTLYFYERESTSEYPIWVQALGILTKDSFDDLTELENYLDSFVKDDIALRPSLYPNKGDTSKYNEYKVILECYVAKVHYITGERELLYKTREIIFE